MEMDAAAPAAVTFFDFLEKMRNPAALHLVRSIKSFIVSFSFYAPNPDNDGKRVQEFFATMEAAITDHPLWAAATDEEIDCAVEGLEKYVMTKLFPRTFAASSEDVKIDNEVSDKIQLLQTFLRPEHLDIPEVLQNETSWLLAEKELLKINSFKAPREKLQWIMSCCRVINNLLLNASMSENRVVGGADDFLPVLIYVMIKANPPKLHSNLRFIQLYRRQTKLVSESAYFFTSLISAKTFILELNASSLSIDEIEFEESMQQARSTSSVIQNDALAGMGEAVATPHFSPSTAMNSLHTNITNRSNFPYMDKEPGQLTVEDVPRLLGLYKDVVTRYTNLRNAMGLMTISRRDSPRPILRRPDETSSPRMEQTYSLSSSGENTENSGKVGLTDDAALVAMDGSGDVLLDDVEGNESLAGAEQHLPRQQEGKEGGVGGGPRVTIQEPPNPLPERPPAVSVSAGESVEFVEIRRHAVVPLRPLHRTVVHHHPWSGFPSCP